MIFLPSHINLSDFDEVKPHAKHLPEKLADAFNTKLNMIDWYPNRFARANQYHQEMIGMLLDSNYTQKRRFLNLLSFRVRTQAVKRSSDVDPLEDITGWQIERYFEVQDLVDTGELMDARDHPLLPGDYHAMHMVDWLKRAAPQLVITCPVSQKTYVHQFESLETLAEIPGFWQAVEAAFGGAGDWLRKLITCPKVQQAALISAI